jgi:hypothetical protein
MCAPGLAVGILSLLKGRPKLGRGEELNLNKYQSLLIFCPVLGSLSRLSLCPCLYLPLAQRVSPPPSSKSRLTLAVCRIQ